LCFQASYVLQGGAPGSEVSPYYARTTCCDRGYGRTSERPRVSNLAAY